MSPTSFQAGTGPVKSRLARPGPAGAPSSGMAALFSELGAMPRMPGPLTHLRTRQGVAPASPPAEAPARIRRRGCGPTPARRARRPPSDRPTGRPARPPRASCRSPSETPPARGPSSPRDDSPSPPPSGGACHLAWLAAKRALAFLRDPFPRPGSRTRLRSSRTPSGSCLPGALPSGRPRRAFTRRCGVSWWSPSPSPLPSPSRRTT